MEEIFRLKAQKDRAAREAAEREKQQQLRPQQVSGNRRFELEDDMDIDENNNTLEEGAAGYANSTGQRRVQGTNGQEENGQDCNEDMLDETEQDEFNAQ